MIERIGHQFAHAQGHGIEGVGILETGPAPPDKGTGQPGRRGRRWKLKPRVAGHHDDPPTRSHPDEHANGAKQKSPTAFEECSPHNVVVRLPLNVIVRYDRPVPKTSNLDVLLALLGTSVDGPVDGDTVTRRLAANGRELTASRLLAQLLALEASGHLEVSRENGYRFALTPFGEEAAYELGPGDAIDVVLVMVDLVGFVAFTAEQGDSAAHQVARQLQDLGDAELRRAGGKLVKPLGDGFLGTVHTFSGGVGIVRNVAQQCRRPDGRPWPLRAAVHRGRPISFRGDLFGADVNLTARLCSAAEPGELVMTTAPGDPHAEALNVRGLTDPISVTRMAVP